MKISISFERGDIRPAVLWGLWLIGLGLIMTSAFGSLAEFEPQAAAIFFAAGAAWCFPALVAFRRRFARRPGR